jgi:hypothetical protein
VARLRHSRCERSDYYGAFEYSLTAHNFNPIMAPRASATMAAQKGVRFRIADTTIECGLLGGAEITRLAAAPSRPRRRTAVTQLVKLHRSRS